MINALNQINRVSMIHIRSRQDSTRVTLLSEIILRQIFYVRTFDGFLFCKAAYQIFEFQFSTSKEWCSFTKSLLGFPAHYLIVKIGAIQRVRLTCFARTLFGDYNGEIRFTGCKAVGLHLSRICFANSIPW